MARLQSRERLRKHTLQRLRCCFLQQVRITHKRRRQARQERLHEFSQPGVPHTLGRDPPKKLSEFRADGVRRPDPKNTLALRPDRNLRIHRELRGPWTIGGRGRIP
jgi:hypothetical protein